MLTQEWLLFVPGVLATIVLCGLVGLTLTTLVWFVVDRRQTRHAVRRNFPVLGRFRYGFEHLGEFFRQYFFAMDREELPFNRAERTWAYRAAKNLDNTGAFGSTFNNFADGSFFFLNSAFPALEQQLVAGSPVTIGPQCAHPYVVGRFFHISGMSYGAISKPAVQALSRGAAKAGCWLNTGEGGLSPYHLEGECDLVFQIGTANYGARDSLGALDDDRLAELAREPRIKMFEIKLSQGAKPGKGGILPAAKVTPEIARIRGIAPHSDSISPNGRSDARSVGALLDLVARVRDLTGKPVGIKACIGTAAWVEELCQTVHSRGTASAPDFFTVDSGDGGTGAAPQSLMDHMGMPIRESLPLVVDILTRHGLHGRVRVIAAGKLVHPARAAWALAMGADFVVSARGFMFALGCIQAMQCNRNTCPTGVTTHDPRLQRGLVPANKAERVAHYANNVEREVGVIAHACGVEDPRQLTPDQVRWVTGAGLSQPIRSVHAMRQ